MDVDDRLRIADDKYNKVRRALDKVEELENLRQAIFMNLCYTLITSIC